MGKFTGKHLYQSLFFNKVASKPAILLKKRFWHWYCPANFLEFCIRFFIEHLSTAASHYTKKWSFPFRIPSINVKKSEEILILKNAEEILMENFIFHAVSAVFLVTEIFYENLVTNRWTHLTPMFYFYIPSTLPENVRNQLFSDVIRGYRNGLLAWIGLRKDSGVTTIVNLEIF